MSEQGGVPAVPEYMKKFMDMSMTDAASMAASSVSVPRISYRGKRFRFIENSEEEMVKELTVRVIILGVEPDVGKFIKTYYDKGYEPGSVDPPTCSSSDGIRPDEWVPQKQSDLCASCPKNVFGSATSMKGGKAKACKDSKRLWVTKDPATYPNANVNIAYALNIPVMSLKHLSEYGKYIGRSKYPLALVVTEIGFDDESEFPKLTFKHVGFVPEDRSEAVIKISSERPWKSTFDAAQIPYDDNSNATVTAPQPSPQTGGSATGENIDEVVGKW